jgi:hypothetical protein
MRGLDDRSRGEDGRIRRKRSDTKVETLRETYGDDFGNKVRGDAKLGTLLERTGVSSLDEYLKRFRR